MTIAINVSPMQFRHPAFVSVLADAINEFGVDPAFLQIEVTESAIMDDVPDTVETLNRLQAMGCAPRTGALAAALVRGAHPSQAG